MGVMRPGYKMKVIYSKQKAKELNIVFSTPSGISSFLDTCSGRWKMIEVQGQTEIERYRETDN